MINCDICGKECKTGQGLAGHKQWVHGIAPAKSQLRLEPTTKSATKLELEELDDRLELTELVAEQLTEQVKTSGEQHAKQLNELQKQVEQHAKRLDEQASYSNILVVLNNKVVEVVGQVGHLTERLDRTIRVFNVNKQLYDGIFEKLQNGLEDAKSRLAKHGHDDLKLVPDLVKKIGNLEQLLLNTQSRVEQLERVAIRYPTGDIAELKLTDGKEHNFREYKNTRGLTRPHQTSSDFILGSRWVDLSEPED